jgi:hypothetical protein
VIFIPLNHLAERAKEMPDGYLADVMEQGKVNGDALEITEEAYERLAYKYTPRGAGDVLAHMLHPLAKVLGLTDCGGCKDRQEALNKAFPL